MKTPSRTEAARRRPGTCLPFTALFTLALVAAPVRAEPAAPPKDHALFVGTTLQVEDNGRYAELVGASLHTVTVVTDGKPRELLRKAVGNVRIEPGLRLSNTVARIDNLKTTVVQADAAGDRWAADRMQILMNSMQAQSLDIQDANQRQMAEFQRQAATATTAEAAAAAAAAAENAKANEPALANRSVQLDRSVSSFLPNGNPANALEVSCELSSPKATRNAFALLVTEYRANSRDKPHYKVHVEALSRLGLRPERVTMTQANLPAGFILGRVDVHVYADGQELATNLSEQRVDLTADDALRYLVLCYVATHPKASLAATPLKIALPADFTKQVPAEQLGRTLYVTVAPDGTVQALSGAPDRAVAVDPVVDSAVRKFRYNPALQEGKPVVGTVELTLSSLLR